MAFYVFQPDPSLTSAQFLDGREGSFRRQEGGTAVWPKCNAWNKSGFFFQRFSAATRARIRRNIEFSPKFIEADKSIFEIL